MKNKKLTVWIFIVLLAGVSLLLLRVWSKQPLMTELELVKETTTHVEVSSNNRLYSNFHKRFDAPFVQELFSIVDFEKIEKIPDNTFGGEGLANIWSIWLEFFNDDSRIFWLKLNANGKITTKGGWYAYLTSESQSQLKKLLAKVGLTDELGPIPLVANVPATADVVFRKDSSIPYVIDSAVFVMPDEHFGIGMVVYNSNQGAYSASDYKVYYRDDQSYDDWFDIYFDVGNNGSRERQSHLNIKNNCSFGIGFDLYYVQQGKLECVYVYGGYKVKQNETLSIEADPDVSCYVLTSIRSLYSEPESPQIIQMRAKIKAMEEGGGDTSYKE